MNAQQIENVEIWKQIKGSEKLFDIYTYFPTLHDATIRNINLKLESKEFYLTVDYCDFVKEPGDEVLTRITICWRNTQKADFNMYSGGLIGMSFSHDGKFIKTLFEEYSSGFYGEIIADKIEILDIEIEPEEPVGYDEGTVKFFIQ